MISGTLSLFLAHLAMPDSSTHYINLSLTHRRRHMLVSEWSDLLLYHISSLTVTIGCFRFLDIVHLLVNSAAHTTCLTQIAYSICLKLQIARYIHPMFQCFRFLDIVHLLVNSGAHTTCLTQEAKVTHQCTSDLILWTICQTFSF